MAFCKSIVKQTGFQFGWHFVSAGFAVKCHFSAMDYRSHFRSNIKMHKFVLAGILDVRVHTNGRTFHSNSHRFPCISIEMCAIFCRFLSMVKINSNTVRLVNVGSVAMACIKWFGIAMAGDQRRDGKEK